MPDSVEADAALRTFCAIGKELDCLNGYGEVDLLREEGRGCLTHMWFAMDERVHVRVYVDGEKQPSIAMALDLGHGYAFGGPPEPWGKRKMGRSRCTSGSISGDIRNDR